MNHGKTTREDCRSEVFSRRVMVGYPPENGALKCAQPVGSHNGSWKKQ